MKPVRDVSAGGVVYRQRDGVLQVALVGKITPPRWGLPKGGQQRGESLEQAALREVSEETGLQARLICPLGRAVLGASRPEDRRGHEQKGGTPHVDTPGSGPMRGPEPSGCGSCPSPLACMGYVKGQRHCTVDDCTSHADCPPGILCQQYLNRFTNEFGYACILD